MPDGPAPTLVAKFDILTGAIMGTHTPWWRKELLSFSVPGSTVSRTNQTCADSILY